MVITRTVEMHAQLVGYDFKKKGLPTDKNLSLIHIFLRSTGLFPLTLMGADR